MKWKYQLKVAVKCSISLFVCLHIYNLNNIERGQTIHIFKGKDYRKVQKNENSSVCLDGVEVGALCRPVEFFNTKLGKQDCHVETEKGQSTILSKTSFNAAA